MFDLDLGPEIFGHVAPGVPPENATAAAPGSLRPLLPYIALPYSGLSKLWTNPIPFGVV